MKTNEELITALYLQRNLIYPNGCPIQPRGCSKTFIYLSHFLYYYSFDLCIEQLKRETEERNMEWCKEWISNCYNNLLIKS